MRSPKEHSTVAEAVRHPLRVRILEVLNQYDMSATQFVGQGYADAYFGRRPGVSQISYHFRELAQFGCLEVVALRPARGSVATIYRGVARAEFIGEDWVGLSGTEKRRLSRAVARGLIARIDGAMSASTFDARDDRHLAWFAMRLDERGWKEVGAVLTDAFAGISRIQGEAETRLQASAQEGLTATASILLFESPELPPPPKAAHPGTEIGGRDGLTGSPAPR